MIFSVILCWNKLICKNYLKALIIEKKPVTFKFHGTNNCKHDGEDTTTCKKWWKLLVAWQKVCKSASAVKIKCEHPTSFNDGKTTSWILDFLLAQNIGDVFDNRFLDLPTAVHVQTQGVLELFLNKYIYWWNIKLKVGMFFYFMNSNALSGRLFRVPYFFVR